jgi:hypothetical protein
MSELEPKQQTAIEEEEIDEIAEFVAREGITAVHTLVENRPDVTPEEQLLWKQQDPEYPPEHYRCVLRCGPQELEIYQTVGADYPDEDEEADNSDLYRDSRELLLSPEFLIESAALKAHSVETANNVEQWIIDGYCVTAAPKETYEQFQEIRLKLIDMLGEDRYSTLIKLSIAAEQEREEESEDWY